MIRVLRFFVIGLAVMAAACGGSSLPTSPSANVPFSVTDLRVGSGLEATNGRLVAVNYTGWLYDAGAAGNKGTQFDSSVGRSPLTVLVGSGGVIPGFERGIIGMRVGGLRSVVIPPDLGYGSRGAGTTIPQNATLVFEIELLAVQ